MDISMELDGVRFNLCVRVVILRDGCVLMIRGKDSGKYFPVGGRVQAGETSEQAAYRECLEETGMDCTIERLLFVTESVFNDEGRHAHEVSFYYLMNPGNAEPQAATDNGEALEWLPIEKLDNLLFPEFFQTELQNLPETVRHIVNNRIK